jgi:hypothetical protein
MRNAYIVFVGQPERKRHRWDDKINVNVKEVGYQYVKCFHLSQEEG